MPHDVVDNSNGATLAATKIATQKFRIETSSDNRVSLVENLHLGKTRQIIPQIATPAWMPQIDETESDTISIIYLASMYRTLVHTSQEEPTLSLHITSLRAPRSG